MNGADIFKRSKWRYFTPHTENATIRKRKKNKKQPTYLESVNSKISDKFQESIFFWATTNDNAKWVNGAGIFKSSKWRYSTPYAENATIRKRIKNKTQPT